MVRLTVSYLSKFENFLLLQFGLSVSSDYEPEVHSHKAKG